MLNKPKFWDYKKFSIFPYFFYPFSILLNLLNTIKFNYFKKKKFDIPIVLVGNIYLGGTGKTPLCIEIYNILKNLNVNPAFVKKYYAKFQDETRLLEKFGKVFSNKKRAEAIKLLINDKFQIAILDDGFQDPNIISDLSIVCFNEKQWIGNGFVIPSGPLREKLVSLKRCDLVFINGKRNFEIEKIIYKFNSEVKIFYTEYKTTNLYNIKNKKVVAFAGIGNSQNFFDLIEKNNIEMVKTFNYPDHYNFNKKDILKLKDIAKKMNAFLVTTEKDYLRISSEERENIIFLGINLEINNKENFINELKKII